MVRASVRPYLHGEDRVDDAISTRAIPLSCLRWTRREVHHSTRLVSMSGFLLRIFPISSDTMLLNTKIFSMESSSNAKTKQYQCQVFSIELLFFYQIFKGGSFIVVLCDGFKPSILSHFAGCIHWAGWTHRTTCNCFFHPYTVSLN